MTPGIVRRGGQLLRPMGSWSGAVHEYLRPIGLARRRAVLPALQRCRLLATERVKYAPVSAAEAADALENQARELRWLQSVRSDLDRSLA